MTDPSAASVNAISLKLPPFWPADPDLWFAQVEAQFSTRGITVEKTKFDYIITALAPDTATTVRDLILSPPADSPYAALKKALIKRTVGSNQHKLQRLLGDVELGDQKPSQLRDACGSSGATMQVRISCESCSCSGFLPMCAWFWPPQTPPSLWMTWQRWLTASWKHRGQLLLQCTLLLPLPTLLS